MPWVGVSGRFPHYRSRSAQVTIPQDRINDCFQRSLDGTALAWGEGIWSTLTQLVVQPFTLIAIALLYADRVMRVDGRLPR